MKVLCFLLVVIAAVCEANLEEWNTFKKIYGKNYTSSVEEEIRMKIYHMNKQKIDDHNKKFEQGLVSYSLKINPFGDLMHHEFKAMMNGYNRSTSNMRTGGTSFVLPEDTDLPETVDWTAKGAVTPVKNQLLCGSCWAFGATGSLEGQLFLKTGELVSLSEQQLIDCSRKYGNYGCFGGSAEYAFMYIIDNGGIDTESSYGYWGLDLWCRYKKSKVGATISGYVTIPEGDEEALKSAVATAGPVSVAIDASEIAFQFYYGGVYDESSCSSSSLDHEVLVVGYGTEDGKDYWLVKNSWGRLWGESGYIKMSRNRNNQCGIATEALYPTI